MAMFNTERVPVTVYKSSDDGAPKNTGGAGNLKTILKACLVTGYGSKQPLGWEALFEEDYKIVFRSKNPKSSKCCLYIDNTKARAVSVAAYSAMDSIASGSDRFINMGFPYFPNGNGEKEWWLIGHDRTFILLLSGYYPGGIGLLYFGDFHSVVAGDNANCVGLLTRPNSSEEYMTSFSRTPFVGDEGDTSYFNSRFAKSYDGVKVSQLAKTLSLGKGQSWRGNYPSPMTGGFSISEIYLHEIAISGVSGIRGLLGGVYWSYERLDAIPNGKVFDNVDDSGDRWMKFEMNDNNSTGDYGCLVNATAWEI